MDAFIEYYEYSKKDEYFEQMRIYGKLDVLTYDLLMYFTATFSDDMIYKVLPCINEFWLSLGPRNKTYGYSIFELIINYEWKSIINDKFVKETYKEVIL